MVVGAFEGGEVDRGLDQGADGPRCFESSVVSAAAVAAEQGEDVTGL